MLHYVKYTAASHTAGVEGAREWSQLIDFGSVLLDHDPQKTREKNAVVTHREYMGF